MADLGNLAQLMGDLDEEGVLAIVDKLVAEGASAEEGNAAIQELQKGMNIVGDLFESGEYFVGDLIFAGEILTGAIERCKPLIAGTTTEKLGVMVLGTVHGDLHDIGKNIFKNMVEIAGFEVHDIGIDQNPETFVEKIKETGAGYVGMSGVLTLALDSMRETVDAIKEAGLREKVKIIIGGNCVTAEACKTIGADAWTTNAAEGVRICKGWV
ncbi:MAG: cobalamin-binding protein [Eubacteriaceae bacterium]|nr:cobalamin-binding protein [Eubacteriaceae bacterium]